MYYYTETAETSPTDGGDDGTRIYLLIFTTAVFTSYVCQPAQIICQYKTYQVLITTNIRVKMSRWLEDEE
jgi:hypothetical protein